MILKATGGWTPTDEATGKAFSGMLSRLRSLDKMIEEGRKSQYAAWHARDCKCSNRVLRRQIISNGQEWFRFQCLDCGSLDKPVKKVSLTDKQKEEATEIDREKESQLHASVTEKVESLRKTIGFLEGQARSIRMSSQFYEMYLSSDEWARKRVSIFSRSGGMCEACNLSPACDVHHLTYARLGNEQNEDLQAVCRVCHSILHSSGAGQ